jgi:subtilisin family serine protease
LLRVRVPEDVNIDQSLNYLRYLPDIIIYAEPNWIYHLATYYPNDEYLNLLWGLFNIGQAQGTIGCDIDAPSAWNVFRGSTDVVVAVLGTGVNYNHPDLAENMWTNQGEIPDNDYDDDNNGYDDDVRGWDFFNQNNDPIDYHGHETHVAGIIGARGGNITGIVGVNWNIKIMPLTRTVELVKSLTDNIRVTAFVDDEGQRYRVERKATITVEISQ